MNDDLISVIIPVYNVQDYLQECLTSVLNQTYRKLEIILVDDGSTDESGILCDQYAEKDDRISVMHKMNGGLSSARNCGIESAHGKYISFIDSDDYIALDMIEILYSAICETKTQVACCDYFLFKEDAVFDSRSRHEKKYEVVEQTEALRLLFSMNYYRFLACNKLYEKVLFEKIRFPEGKFYEDIWPIYNVFKHITRIAYIKQTLYFYRYRNSSISKSAFGRKDYDLLENIALASEDCIANFPDVKEYAHTAYIYYALSFVNKAIISNAKIQFEKKQIKHYVRNNISSLFRVKELSVSRRIQVFLFAFSVRVYSAFYKVFHRFID